MTITRMVAGRYRLDREIGRGSMGTVWDAYDEVLRRRVAIKEVNFPAGLPAAEVDQLSDRTLREARAIAALSHPHVITVFDIVMVGSGPVIVMELMQAPSLADILAEQGPLAPIDAAVIGRAVASGLGAAHHAGITHRDVKPANVLIASDGRIKLTDFGIARAAGEQTLTATGILLGSPAYISPEVASGRPATPSADAWGLGALLYASVEGQPPFDRGKPIATLAAVVSDPAPPHPHAGPLGPIIDALLVKNPGRRMPVNEAAEKLAAMARGAVYLPTVASTTGATTSRPDDEPAPEQDTADSSGEALPAPVPSHLPPPPWATIGTAQLPPLPGRAEPESAAEKARRRMTVWAVGLGAAVIGFLLVITAAHL